MRPLAASLTWKPIFTSDLHWYNLEVVGRNVLYAVGANGWDGPHVPATWAKSTDGGTTWKTSQLPSRGWLSGLDCKDANTCWLAGRGGTNLKTTDGGNTWTVLSSAGYTGWEYTVALTGVGDSVVVGLTCSEPAFLRSTNGVTFTGVKSVPVRSRTTSVVRRRGSATPQPSWAAFTRRPTMAPVGFRARAATAPGSGGSTARVRTLVGQSVMGGSSGTPAMDSRPSSANRPISRPRCGSRRSTCWTRNTATRSVATTIEPRTTPALAAAQSIAPTMA